MTPQEFKAWFEAFDRLPTKTQWARVKECVAEIDGHSITERVFVDRYYPRYWHAGAINPPYWTTYCSNTSSAVGTIVQAAAANSVINQGQNGIATSNFNSTAAMYALDKSEAQGSA